MEIDREVVMPIFLGESADNLGALEEAVLRLEAAPADEEALATIFRCAHTLKGNAEALGIDALAACAHAVESVLDGLRKQALSVTRPIVSLILEGHDALRGMLAAAAAGATPSADACAELVGRLSAAAEGQIPEPEGEPSPPAVAPVARDWSARRATLRVDLRTLDRILTFTGELSIARARLRTVLDRAVPLAEASDAMGETDRIFDDLREQVMRLRLVPVGPLFRQQLRAVRDLAPAHGKLARLAIEGEDVEVDTEVVERLRDPVMHMIRNAIDHALETPSARRDMGKDPTGTITLRARHRAGRIIVEVADDGAGFDRARILARARGLGMPIDEAVVRDADVYALVLSAGFSTSESASDLSGRGVGMDVVARNVAAIKGTIAIDSTRGRGSVVSVSVPLTLAIINGFAVRAADETYVIPLESVRECVALPPRHGSADRAGGVLNLRGEVLPYVRLRDAFCLPGAVPCNESVVVVEHEGGRAGLAVDELRGESQAVVKPLAAMLGGTGAIAGSTILGDGRVALILDVASILRSAKARVAAACEVPS